MSRIERVQQASYGDSLPWQPQPLWLLAGLVLGGICGALVGAVMLMSAGSAGDLEAVLWIGGWYGALVGAVVGLVVGLVLTFAGGSHLGPETARDRATAVATLATLVVVGLITSPFLLSPFPFFPVVVAAVAATLAGSLARWVATRL